MNQYTPCKHLYIDGAIDDRYSNLLRRLSEEEYEDVVDYAIEIGIENGFVQEGETAKESFIPDFDMEGV